MATANQLPPPKPPILPHSTNATSKLPQTPINLLPAPPPQHPAAPPTLSLLPPLDTSNPVSPQPHPDRPDRPDRPGHPGLSFSIAEILGTKNHSSVGGFNLTHNNNSVDDNNTSELKNLFQASWAPSVCRPPAYVHADYTSHHSGDFTPVPLGWMSERVAGAEYSPPPHARTRTHRRTTYSILARLWLVRASIKQTETHEAPPPPLRRRCCLKRDILRLL